MAIIKLRELKTRTKTQVLLCVNRGYLNEEGDTKGRSCLCSVALANRLGPSHSLFSLGWGKTKEVPARGAQAKEAVDSYHAIEIGTMLKIN